MPANLLDSEMAAPPVDSLDNGIGGLIEPVSDDEAMALAVEEAAEEIPDNSALLSRCSLSRISMSSPFHFLLDNIRENGKGIWRSYLRKSHAVCSCNFFAAGIVVIFCMQVKVMCQSFSILGAGCLPGIMKNTVPSAGDDRDLRNQPRSCV